MVVLVRLLLESGENVELMMMMIEILLFCSERDRRMRVFRYYG